MNTMTAVQANNLRMLIDHIEESGEDLDLSNFNRCALSAALKVPEIVMQGLQRWDNGIQLMTCRTSFESARKLFGVSDSESWELFATGFGIGKCTAARWSQRAREILAAHGYPAVAEFSCPHGFAECRDANSCQNPDSCQQDYSVYNKLLQRLTAPVRVRG